MAPCPRPFALQEGCGKNREQLTISESGREEEIAKQMKRMDIFTIYKQLGKCIFLFICDSVKNLTFRVSFLPYLSFFKSVHQICWWSDLIKLIYCKNENLNVILFMQHPSFIIYILFLLPPDLPPSPRPTVLDLLHNLTRDEKLSNGNVDCSPISPEESNGSDIVCIK